MKKTSSHSGGFGQKLDQGIIEPLNAIFPESIPIVRAFYLSVPLLIGLTLFTAFNPKGDFWGTVESPKAQCEAYDVQRLKPR